MPLRSAGTQGARLATSIKRDGNEWAWVVNIAPTAATVLALLGEVVGEVVHTAPLVVMPGPVEADVHLHSQKREPLQPAAAAIT